MLYIFQRLSADNVSESFFSSQALVTSLNHMLVSTNVSSRLQSLVLSVVKTSTRDLERFAQMAKSTTDPHFR
jgi:hypothetical protein